MKKLLAVTTCTMLGLSSISVSAETYRDGSYEYAVEEGKAIIVGYYGSENGIVNLEIPKSLGGYPVTAIGDDAFYSKGIKHLTLPEGLVSIGERAFAETPLREIVIPASVTQISERAFASCVAMESLSVDEGSLYYTSEDNVLFSKDKKELIVAAAGGVVGNYVVPDGVEVIDCAAFLTVFS